MGVWIFNLFLEDVRDVDQGLCDRNKVSQGLLLVVFSRFDFHGGGLFGLKTT